MPLRQIRWEWLLATALGMLILLVGGFLWHRRQVRLLAPSLLQRAKVLESAGRWREAADYCWRYSVLYPDDPAVAARLARNFDRAAETPAAQGRAAELYRLAVALAPENTDLRERLAELLFEAALDSSASAEAEELLRRDPENAVAWRVRGMTAYLLGRSQGGPALTQAVQFLERAVSLNPSDVHLATRLAEIYLRELDDRQEPERIDRATELLDALVKANPQSGRARVARARLLAEISPGSSQIDDDLQAAVGLAPDETETWLALAERRVAQARGGEALEALARIPPDRHSHPAVRQLTGDALAGLGRWDEALTAWRAGWEAPGDFRPTLGLRVANALLELGRNAEAGAVLGRMEERIAETRRDPSGDPESFDRLAAALALAHSRLALVQGSPSQARKWLEPWLVSASRLDRLPPQVACDLRRQEARCEREAGHLERAAMALDEACVFAPGNVSLRVEAAEAWQALGHGARAGQLFAEASRLEVREPRSALWAARAELQLQAGRPRLRRDWTAFFTVLARAEEEPGLWRDVELLRVEQLAWQGDFAQARETLERLAQNQPADRPVAEALAWAAVEWGPLDAAERQLAHFEGEFGISSLSRLLRSEWQARQGRLAEAAAALEEAARTAGDASASPLWRQALAFQSQLGQPTAAVSLARAVLADSAADGKALWAAAQTALAAGDPSLWAEACQAVATRSGELNPSRRALDAELLRQCLQPQPLTDAWTAPFTGDDTSLSARAGAALAQAQLAEQRAGALVAVDAYAALGSQGPWSGWATLRQLELLLGSGRLLAAQEVLAQLGGRHAGGRLPGIDFNGELSVPVWELGLANLHAAHSLDDPPAQLAGGLAQLCLGQAESAAARLALGPTEATARLPWVLARVLADGGHNTVARQEAIDELASLVPSAGPRRALRGQLAEYWGEDAAARAAYQEIIDDATADAEALILAARWFLARDSRLALRAIKRLQILGALSPETGRELSAAVVPTANEATARGAEDEPIPPAQRRLRAVLLAGALEPASWTAAADSLEALVAIHSEATPADFALLGELYARLGRSDEALAALDRGRVADSDDPRLWASVVEVRLAAGQPDAAAAVLEQLAAQAPDAWSTVVLSARCRAAQGRPTDGCAVLEQWFERQAAGETSPTERAAWRAQGGRCLLELGLTEAAGQWYEAAASWDPTGQREYQQALQTAGATRAALRLALAAWGRQRSAEQAVLVAEALVGAEPSAVRDADALAVLRDALARYPSDAELLYRTSLVALLQGREDQATQLLRRSLAARPDHVSSLNNLASLLAGDLATAREALRLVRRARELAPDEPALIDTEGVVLLQLGETAAALQLLERVVGAAPAGSLENLHLAAAYDQSGRSDAAAAHLRNAREMGVERQLLTTTDQRLFRRLTSRLERP